MTALQFTLLIIVWIALVVIGVAWDLHRSDKKAREREAALHDWWKDPR